MSKQSLEVLEQMGLSEGYHVPIANAENVQLEQEFQRLILAKAKAVADLENIQTRCAGLQKHLKFVKHEQIDYQNLLVTQNNQLKHERQLYCLIKMERDKYLSDVKKIIQESLKFDTSKESKCNNLKHVMNRLAKLKTVVKWDEKMIESLEEQLSKKSEDNDLLLKFSKEDRRRVEELEIKRLRLREEELARKQLVVRMASERECLQLALGKNLQLYKQMHFERNTMVRQWQESVKQLQQRSKDMITANNEIETLLEQIQINKQTWNEQHQFAENERANNYEIEMKIAQDRIDITRLKNKLEKTMVENKDKKSEKDKIKRELRISAIALKNQQAIARKYVKDLIKRDIIMNDAVQEISRLKDQLVSVTETSMTSEERVRRFENLIKNEEAIQRSLLSEIQRLQEAFYRSQQTLFDEKSKYKIKSLEQKVIESKIVNLEKTIVQLEEQLKNTAEDIYRKTFTANMLESRLARLTSGRKDDSAEEYQLKFNSLEAPLAAINETAHLLQTQIKRVDDDRRRLNAAVSSDDQIVQVIRDKLHDKLLSCEGAIAQVGQNTARNNKLKVDYNVLAVRVKGATKSLKMDSGVVYGLQMHRMELESVIRERQEEIAVKREVLISTRRAIQDDNGRMMADYRIRQVRMEQLKKRVDGVLESLGKSETGEPLSVTYFKVRNAQEKFALQQEGDRLDKLIRKTEREIVAMENTLRIMNSANDMYKHTLSMLEDDADEVAAAERFQEKLVHLSQELREKHTALTQRSKIVRDTRENLETIRARYQELCLERVEKMEAYNDIDRDEKNREAMLSRAEAAVKISDSCTCGDEYKDFSARQLREVNRSALQQLTEASVRYCVTSPLINRYLNERGISLPSPSLSSRSSSRRSVQSSRSTKTGKSDTSVSNHSAISAVTLTLNLP